MMTALETLLNVLPHTSLAPRGNAEEGGLSGAASDFEALEKLRRLAFAESVPAPHIQLEARSPALRNAGGARFRSDGRVGI